MGYLTASLSLKLNKTNVKIGDWPIKGYWKVHSRTFMFEFFWFRLSWFLHDFRYFYRIPIVFIAAILIYRMFVIPTQLLHHANARHAILQTQIQIR